MPGTLASFDDGYYYGDEPVYDTGYRPEIEVERVKPAVRDRPPAVVLSQMAQVMSDLAVHGVEYQQALTRQASAKVAFEREKAKALVSLVDEYKRAGDRLPAEDVRNALTLEKLEEFYVPLLAADADVVGLKAVLDVEKSLLMGLQSELRVLREEVA